MNISNIILNLQTIASQSTDSLTQLVFSKCIEKLKVGSITVLETFDQLPSGLETDGNVFLIQSDQQLYYNVGNKYLVISREEGDLAYAWGSNIQGQLGDGTTTSSNLPVNVIGGITNWSQLSGGAIHSLGLTDDGIAYAWGNNLNGRLGDGTTTSSNSPITVIGDITNWSQVSAGNDHSLGLTDDGIAYAWGAGSSGRLGDGTTVAKSSPVTMIGDITNWSQVSAGAFHSLGVTDDGVAYAWGLNQFGRLGDGTTIARSSPVTVIGDITNWSQVSGGALHSLGLTDDGIAYAWGRNLTGGLGDGTRIDKSSPITVIGGITNWSQVSAGGGHSLGLTDDGIAYAWGSSAQGRLGDGTTVNKSSPITVIGGITNWSQLSAGSSHSLGLTDDGIAYAWGFGNEGRLGDGTAAIRSSPVTVVGGITNWSQVSAGDAHSLGVTNQVKQFNK